MVTLIQIVDWAFGALNLLVLVRVLVSWVPGLDPYHPIVQFVYRATEPIMAPVRRLLPPMGGLDLSPIVVFLLLYVARSVVLGLLVQSAVMLP